MTLQSPAPKMRAVSSRSKHKLRADRYRTYLNRVQAHLGDYDNPNPFAQERQRLALTLEGLAILTGVSKQAIIRLEQGIPDKPIEAVASHFNIDNIAFKYESFKFETRCRNALVFGRAIPSALAFADVMEIHPLTYLLSEYWHYADNDEPVNARMNPTEFSKLLCVNQSIVDHWLNRVSRQQTVPKPVLQALSENGYKAAQLEQIELAYANHRQYVITGMKEVVNNTQINTSLENIKNQMMQDLKDG